MEEAGARTRERIWVTKFDHSTEPPTPVEEVFAEDGVVIARRDLAVPVAEGGDPVEGVERLAAIVSALKPGESVIIKAGTYHDEEATPDTPAAAPRAEKEEEQHGRTEAVRRRWE